MNSVIANLEIHYNTENAIKNGFSNLINGSFTQSQAGYFFGYLKGSNINPMKYLEFVANEILSKVDFAKSPECLDVCGTGGDGLKTLNISTAAAFVLASGGVKITKHGNKAVSSSSGSSDVLRELGINIAHDKTQIESNIQNEILSFISAPHVFEFLQNLGIVRREIGVKTIFNFIGPLINPAKPQRQLVGISVNDTQKYCQILKNLGRKRAIVAHSENGGDEIMPFCTANISELLPDGNIKNWIFDPKEIPEFCNENQQEIIGADAKYNARRMIQIFSNNTKDAYRDSVILNSAFGFYVANKCHTIPEGCNYAKTLLDSGMVLNFLNEFIQKNSL